MSRDKSGTSGPRGERAPRKNGGGGKSGAARRFHGAKPQPDNAARGERRQSRERQQRPDPKGLAARELAAHILWRVLEKHEALDDVLQRTYGEARFADLEARDRAFARLVAVTALRGLGRLEAVLNSYLQKGLPADRGSLWPILLSGAAQLLMLKSPAHAVINLAVEQTRGDRKARRFDKLVNAVLRRVASEGEERLAALDAFALDIPAWLAARWQTAYGAERARAIALASLQPAALDITVKADAEAWAERLGGRVLPTGSVRLAGGGRIEELPGFAEGEWWVQDAAAALPGRLLGDIAGRSCLDMCAAPGGKTAELAHAGARVTAVEIDRVRAERLSANLARLKLSAEVVCADVVEWRPQATFDAVLLDAPCSATGTIRRHPDILRLKRDTDIARIAAVQECLLAAAADFVAPGGVLVYCTCSLEPEEGSQQVARLLAARADLTREPIRPGEAGIAADWLTSEGDLRTLPCHLAIEPAELAGLDGFYAARLRRLA